MNMVVHDGNGSENAAAVFSRFLEPRQHNLGPFQVEMNGWTFQLRLGGPAQWSCSDVKFSLAYLSIDELESPVRERIEAIPTRLTLDAAQVDAAIEAAREGTLGLHRLREYVQDRVPSTR